VLFGLWPILLSVQVSFTASATALRAAPTWVGFANYASVLADPLFLASLTRTLTLHGAGGRRQPRLRAAGAALLDSTLLRRANLFFRSSRCSCRS
jgi:multiple sugar transport system permease protein